MARKEQKEIMEQRNIQAPFSVFELVFTTLLMWVGWEILFQDLSFLHYIGWRENKNLFHIVPTTMLGIVGTSVYLFHYFNSWINENKNKKLKKQVDFTKKPKKLFGISTCYNMSRKTVEDHLNSVFNEFHKYDLPGEIIFLFSAKKRGEEEVSLATKTFRNFKLKHPNLKFVPIFGKQDGYGKRFALWEAITYISKKINFFDACIIMDGDTLFVPRTFENILPWLFQTNIEKLRNLGAVITSTKAIVRENSWLAKMLYTLRYLKMDISKSSVVTVLTGRAVFLHGSIITEELAEMIKDNFVNHPIHGIIKRKSGDDKDTFFYVLTKGMKSLFLKDEFIVTIEDLLYARTIFHKHFFLLRFAEEAMIRYTGNKFLFSSRTTRELGRKKLGTLLYFSLLYQRFLWWTPLLPWITGMSIVMQIGIHQNLNYGIKGFFFMLYSFAITTGLIKSIMLAIRVKYWNPCFILLFPTFDLLTGIINLIEKFRFGTSKWKREKNEGNLSYTSEFISISAFYLIILAGTISIFI